MQLVKVAVGIAREEVLRLRQCDALRKLSGAVLFQEKSKAKRELRLERERKECGTWTCRQTTHSAPELPGVRSESRRRRKSARAMRRILRLARPSIRL